MKRIIFIFQFLFISLFLLAQKVQVEEIASSEQIARAPIESEKLLPMNDLDMEAGYVLYQANIAIETESASLEFDNVRDYAVVYLDNQLQGTVTDNRKKITLTASPGKYTLRLYVENIGRITYGPEILDNSKGLFGNAYLDGEEITDWKIAELQVKDCLVNDLTFTKQKTSELPGFHKGYFQIDEPKDTYLDITGWGMGEAWINGEYIGSYWEEEKQQSLQIPASVLKKGKNDVVVFELKNNKQEFIQFSDTPVFK